MAPENRDFIRFFYARSWILECHFVTSTVKKIPQIPRNAGTNFKLQDVKQSEDTEDETGAVF
jgi:hypothetical protein